MKKAVVAVVIRGVDQVLAIPRKTSGAIGFPGGKVEDNETLEEAMRRELLQETGIEAGQATMLYVGTDAEDYEVTAFLVSNWSGTPEAKEGPVPRFVGWDELCSDASPWPDYNRKVRLAYERRICGEIHVGESKYVGAMPIRSDLSLTPEGAVTQPGWTMATYDGIEVFLENKLDVTLTSEDDIQNGTRLWVHGFNGVYTMTVRNRNGDEAEAISEDGRMMAPLVFAGDDRGCWVAECLINTRGLRPEE